MHMDPDDSLPDILSESAYTGPVRNLSFKEALQYVDQTWSIDLGKAARWMDLVGDYAGSEPYIVDGTLVVSLKFWELIFFSIGESLLQLVLSDPLLALGQPDGAEPLSRECTIPNDKHQTPVSKYYMHIIPWNVFYGTLSFVRRTLMLYSGVVCVGPLKPQGLSFHRLIIRYVYRQSMRYVAYRRLSTCCCIKDVGASTSRTTSSKAQ